MTSSEAKTGLDQVLSHLLMLLHPDVIRVRIDDPIAKALVRVRAPDGECLTQAEFNKTVAWATQEMYRHGLSPPRQLTHAQALGEGVALLEKGYQGGYEGALREAVTKYRVIPDWIVELLADLVKERERRAHIRWVLAKDLDGLDWQAKCRIAGDLAAHLRGLDREIVPHCSPGQLVEALPFLIDLIADALKLVSQASVSQGYWA